MVAASSATNGSSSATAKSTSSTVIPPGMPPPREVARPVVNLGSTCYMNAVLQALAHAPELCLAMDVDPHHVTCPIAKENRKRRASSATASPTSSPEAGEHQTENDFRRNNTKQNPRKLRRSSRKSPTVGMDDYITPNNNSSNERDRDRDDEEQNKYCALCEMEWHLQEVHSPPSSSSSSSSSTNNKDKPVAPSFFVHGFIDHVAPWFKLGQQEDSHEFLRLLIDAMQRSCKDARPKVDENNNNDDAAADADAEMLYDDIPDIGGDSATTNKNTNSNSIEDSKDVEYPFKLFRGTVESCVTCASCGATSSTLDPIEDIGLEVTSSSSAQQSSSSMAVSTRGGGGGSPGGGGGGAGVEALADVNSAFQRFARIEELDAGYKCEKCGNSGRATKQSRLASIPPILTLHLKRFRYGATDLPMGRSSGTSSGGIGSTNSRRSTSAKSGSAKIEGHIKFEQIFNLKPYLTDKLQEQKRSMFCRLFAVIVHAGKNSHSGHYVAYVRNVSSNEWWKMDDARVTMASIDEVMNAEAYMLFYRVLDHPFAVKLEDKAKKMKDERKALLSRLAAEAKAEEEAKKAKQEEEAKAAAADSTSTTTAMETEKENVPAAENKKAVESPAAATKTSGSTSGAGGDAKAIKSETASPSKPDTSSSSAPNKTTPAQSSSSGGGGGATAAAGAASNSNNNSSSSNRKRGLPTYSDGKSWAKANTRLKTNQYSSLRSAEEYINENVQFKPEFFKRINEEGSKTNAKMDQCPIKRITGDDVVGGYSKFSLGLKKTIHRIAQRYEEENGESLFTAPVAAAGAKTEAGAKSNLLDKFVAVGGTASQDDLL